ncbi:hypothetical protein SAMN05421806_1314 [Streptomyces indicus]|uniref:Uncharacterized protein n=1 Tax=Streptomyces indicus TaxID=417292 RepID=A0A1G9JGV2_9ACTN|nr:hypothetical protein SAMN05421806_1314 [Streptomyces indicus]
MNIGGFYQEFWSSAFGVLTGAVTDFVAKAPYEDSEKIMAYLRSGYEMISTMGMTRDVLGSDQQFAGGDSLISDGEWLCRGDTWHYVRLHNMQLPEEFLAHVREVGYIMPAVERPRLLDVSTYIQERW